MYNIDDFIEKCIVYTLVYIGMDSKIWKYKILHAVTIKGYKWVTEEPWLLLSFFYAALSKSIASININMTVLWPSLPNEVMEESVEHRIV